MEGELSKALKSGKKVTDVDIKLTYENGSSRPSVFDVSYKIDDLKFICNVNFAADTALKKRQPQSVLNELCGCVRFISLTRETSGRKNEKELELCQV